MKQIFLFLNVIVIAFLSSVTILAQTTFEMSEDLIFDFSNAKVQVSELAKHIRASNRTGGGRIILNNVNGSEVSEELLASLNVAKDIWQDYLPYGDTLRLDLYFEEDLNTDINLSILYQLEENQNFFYPSILSRKIFTGEFSATYDAKIYINTSVDWSFGIGEELSYVPKNLTLAFMQCICKCLGFGSSVKNGKRGVEFERRPHASIFDSYIVCNNGNRLTDYISDRNGLQQFSTGGLGDVYFSSNNVSAKLYTPSIFDNNTSLRCTDGEQSLMNYDGGNVNNDLIVDNLTLSILNELGWDFSPSSQQFAIVSDDVDNTGITSAYTSHSFYISPDSGNFTSNYWKLLLPFADGTSSIVCSSVNNIFTIPAILNPEQYEHTIEGDIRGMIIFEGVRDGVTVTLNYPIIFELKPHIISAKVIGTNVNASNPYYFDALVEIRYEGSHYVHAFVEEENSPYLTSYYSSTPYYTKMNLTNIASWGDAWFDITIRNEYGSDNYVLDLPSMVNGAKSSEFSTSTELESVNCENVLHIDVYDIQGNFIGLYNSCNGTLPKGFYLLRFYDKNNVCTKVLKLCVN